MAGKLGFQTPEWNTRQEDEIEKTIAAAGEVGTPGELCVKVGRNISKIHSQELDALTVLLEDDLLTRFYSGNAAYDPRL